MGACKHLKEGGEAEREEARRGQGAAGATQKLGEGEAGNFGMLHGAHNLMIHMGT